MEFLTGEEIYIYAFPSSPATESHYEDSNMSVANITWPTATLPMINRCRGEGMQGEAVCVAPCR